VQAYYNGTVAVVSADCDLDMRMTYRGTQLIPIKIPGLGARDCLISITVSPEYPEDVGVRTYSFRGYLGIKHMAVQRKWHGFNKKISGASKAWATMWVGNEDQIKLHVAGCGITNNSKVMNLNQGFLNLDITRLLPKNMPLKTCVIAGAIRSKYPDIMFSVLVSKYDSAFELLPIPNVEVGFDEITIKSDRTASIIGFNDEMEISNCSEFEVDGSRQNVIRVLTTGGRSVLGIQNAETSKWEWLQ